MFSVVAVKALSVSAFEFPALSPEKKGNPGALVQYLNLPREGGGDIVALIPSGSSSPLISSLRAQDAPPHRSDRTDFKQAQLEWPLWY